jgi:hypothetical protein
MLNSLTGLSSAAMYARVSSDRQPRSIQGVQPHVRFQNHDTSLPQFIRWHNAQAFNWLTLGIPCN